MLVPRAKTSSDGGISTRSRLVKFRRGSRVWRGGATVPLVVTKGAEDGGAGIVMWERDGPTAYAVVLNPAAKLVKFFHARESQVELLASEAVRLS